LKAILKLENVAIANALQLEAARATPAQDQDSEVPRPRPRPRLKSRELQVCQIWTQSNNPQQSYCDFSVWPYDLEHVLSVAFGSEIIFTKFDLRQLIHAW